MKDIIIAAELGRLGASNEFIELGLEHDDNLVRDNVDEWIKNDMATTSNFSGGEFIINAWNGDMKGMRGNANKRNIKALWETFGGEAFR